MDDSACFIDGLHHRLMEGPCPDFVLRYVPSITFVAGERCAERIFNPTTQGVQYEAVPSGPSEGDVVVTIDPSDLRKRGPLMAKSVQISGAGAGSAAEEFLRVYFSRQDACAAAEWRHAAFGVAFGAVPHQLYEWTSPRALEALCYPSALDGLDVCVSSGLTGPGFGNRGYGDPLLGLGYELALVTEPGEGVLLRQFVDWLDYLRLADEDILPLNWLEYQEAVIPGTTVSGFLVLSPAALPPQFPVAHRTAYLNVLLPVNRAELREAKVHGVPTVAQTLFDAGYVKDHVPCVR